MNFKQTKTTTTTKTTGPADLKQFGIEQNGAIPPGIEKEDYSKYFQTTKTTTTKTTEPVDFGDNLKNLGIEGGSIRLQQPQS